MFKKSGTFSKKVVADKVSELLCKDCDHEFVSSLKDSECPECKGKNISEKKDEE